MMVWRGHDKRSAGKARAGSGQARSGQVRPGQARQIVAVRAGEAKQRRGRRAARLAGWQEGRRRRRFSLLPSLQSPFVESRSRIFVSLSFPPWFFSP